MVFQVMLGWDWPVDFFTLHLFVHDVHFAIQHIDVFYIVIFPRQFPPKQLQLC